MKKIALLLLVLCCFNLHAGNKYGIAILKDGTYFKLEVADTPSKMERGLMFRKKLDKNKGMIFVYPTPQPSAFWMKNCLIHLDIIWLSKNGRILHMLENVPPCYGDNCKTYTYNGRAKYVLELHHHTISRFALKVGDRIDISIFNQ